MSSFSLHDLERIMAIRASEDASKSYTKSLLEGGTPKIARKLGEEAIEVIIAAHNENCDAVKNEAADLLFHLMVLLHHKKLSFRDVLDVLEGRTQQSGLEEKASRTK